MMMGPDIDKSALLIVDMQNDFVHPEGGFARLAREAPEAGIDMPFLMGTIPYVQQLADAFSGRGTAGRLSRTHGEARLFRRAVPLLAGRAGSWRLPPVHR